MTLSVLKGAGLGTLSALPAPFSRAVTVWRDAQTGHFAKDPLSRAHAGTVELVTAERSDVLVFRHLLDWQDGSEPEVIRLSVECSSARAARLLGDLPREQLSSFEADLMLSLLQELNPQRARELELEHLHAAHRSDKGKRGADSRARNAQARAQDEARGIRARKTQR